VYWITEMDQSNLQELHSRNLWEWRATPGRKIQVDEMLADFGMAKEGMVRPHMLCRGFIWDSYGEWAAGDLPRAMDWSTLDLLDGKRIIKGTAQLTDDEVVDFEPTWCKYG